MKINAASFFLYQIYKIEMAPLAVQANEQVAHFVRHVHARGAAGVGREMLATVGFPKLYFAKLTHRWGQIRL